MGAGPPPETLSEPGSSRTFQKFNFLGMLVRTTAPSSPRRLSSCWRTFPGWNQLIRCTSGIYVNTQTSPTLSFPSGSFGVLRDSLSFFYSNITAAPKTRLKVPSVFDFHRCVYILISSAAKNVFFYTRRCCDLSRIPPTCQGKKVPACT